MSAPQHIAFLRAINVGGRVVKMAALASLFEELGFAEVATFIASGNVVFRSRATAAALESSIERRLQTALGYPVITFVRSTAEVAAVAACHPFARPVPAGGRLFVGFLRGAPPAAARARIAALTTPTDEFRVKGRELYWLCRTPSMQSIVSGATLEKALGGPATLRNVNTVRRLAAKYPPPS